MIEPQDQQKLSDFWQEWARQKLKYLPKVAALVAALVTQQWWAIPPILAGVAGEKLRDWLMGRFIPLAESDLKKLETEFKALLKDPEVKKAWDEFKAWQKKQDLTDEEILSRLVKQGEQLQKITESLELLNFKPITSQAQLFASTGLKGFRPADLVRRPEASPLAETLISGHTSAVLLHGPALCGKSFLAFKIAQEWLISGRALVVISYPPDPEAWRRLPPDSLVVSDPDQPEPWTSDVIRTALDDCPARLVFCFRTGDARHQTWGDNNWSRIQGLFDEWNLSGGRPAKRARLRLGVVPDEVLDEIISANLAQVFGPRGMTLTEDGRAALKAILRAGPAEEPTSLLGLSRAFFMAAVRRGLTEITAREVAEIAPSDLPEEELTRKIFKETVTNEEENVLRVMARWQSFLYEPAPFIAVRAGYQDLYGEDLGTKHLYLMERLEKSGVVSRLGEQKFCVAWHTLQLEMVGDEAGQVEKEDWLKDSLAWLKNNIVKTAGREEASQQQVGIVGDLASRLAKMGWRREAEGLHRSLLAMFRGPNMEPEQALTANNLGNLLSDLGERDEARKLYEEALGIYRGLAEENPKAYLPDVAMTANNLGILLSDLGEREEARKHYEGALGIYRQLAQENPKAYLDKVATTANNLGNLLAGLGERNEARKLFEEALEIYRGLAQENPRAYLDKVAMTANNLAILSLKENKPDEAAPLVTEAILYHALLVPTAPPVFEPRLAGSVTLARRLYHDSGFDKREEWLKELERVIREKTQLKNVDEVVAFIAQPPG